METSFMYNDDYSTCNKTFVTLRLYSNSLSPQEITNYLGIEPSEIIEKGVEKNILTHESINHNAWFFTSENIINSKDSRRHIDYLADKLLPISDRLKILDSQGAKIDICCFWSSESGQGGPTLSPQQLSKLAELGIEFWFDIY
jgi:hypothetical protein